MVLGTKVASSGMQRTRDILSRYRQLNVWSKLGVFGALASILGVALVLFFPGGSNQTVKVESSPGTMIFQLQGGSTTFTAPSPSVSDTFKPISPALKDHVLRNLTGLRAACPLGKPFVRVEAEAGSSGRRQVAVELGALLSASSVGDFADGTFIGIAPDHPITVYHAPGLQACAQEVAAALHPYIRTSTYFRSDSRLSGIRFYINGTPHFLADGVVELQ